MKVQILKDTSSVTVPDGYNNILVVYKDGFGYNIPKIKSANFVDFEIYKNKYDSYEPDLMIVIGMNRIITPSNRCDFVYEYMQTLTQHIPKISVDTEPFIGEPWRLWFHYSIANCGKFNITYSYIIETEWKHWFYRTNNDCRLSSNNISMFIDNTYSDLNKVESTFSFFSPDKNDFIWYKEAKKHIFSKYNTPKMIINNLLKLANKRFSINLNHNSFKDNRLFIVPDLKIYRFVVEENIRRMNIYNKVIGK